MDDEDEPMVEVEEKRGKRKNELMVEVGYHGEVNGVENPTEEVEERGGKNDDDDGAVNE